MIKQKSKEYTGTCKGKGGSMHIADLDAGNGANGIVGGSIELRAALQQIIVRLSSASLAMVNQRRCLRSGQYGFIWNLPVIFYCINNMESLLTSNDQYPAIHERSAAGIPGMFVPDGNNVIDVYEGFQKAVTSLW